MMIDTALFVVLVVKFFASPSNQEETHKIKTKSDKAGGGCKSWDLLNVGHHLGNAVKNSQASQYQCNCPNELGPIYLSVGHGST